MKFEKGIWCISQGKNNRIYVACTDEDAIAHPQDMLGGGVLLYGKERLEELSEAIQGYLLLIEIWDNMDKLERLYLSMIQDGDGATESAQEIRKRLEDSGFVTDKKESFYRDLLFLYPPTGK